MVSAATGNRTFASPVRSAENNGTIAAPCELREEGNQRLVSGSWTTAAKRPLAHHDIRKHTGCLDLRYEPRPSITRTRPATRVLVAPISKVILALPDR